MHDSLRPRRAVLHFPAFVAFKISSAFSRAPPGAIVTFLLIILGSICLQNGLDLNRHV